jgi:hypothetical protein
MPDQLNIVSRRKSIWSSSTTFHHLPAIIQPYDHESAKKCEEKLSADLFKDNKPIGDAASLTISDEMRARIQGLGTDISSSQDTSTVQSPYGGIKSNDLKICPDPGPHPAKTGRMIPD